MPMGINAYDYDFSHFSRIIIWRNEEMCVPLQNALELINYETKSGSNL
jgi:hypothetical protein